MTSPRPNPKLGLLARVTPAAWACEGSTKREPIDAASSSVSAVPRIADSLPRIGHHKREGAARAEASAGATLSTDAHVLLYSRRAGPPHQVVHQSERFITTQVPAQKGCMQLMQHLHLKRAWLAKAVAARAEKAEAPPPPPPYSLWQCLFPWQVPLCRRLPRGNVEGRRPAVDEGSHSHNRPAATAYPPLPCTPL